MVSIKLLVLGIAGLAIAHPEPTRAANLDKRVDCAKVNGALTVLRKLGPPATAFCSSYLRIPATTTIKTTSTPVSTTTVTTTTTIRGDCGQQKKHRRKREVLFNEPQDSIEDLEKRTNILPLLAAFAAAKVSDGCRCLNIKPKATKVTIVEAPTSVTTATETSTQFCEPQIGRAHV